MSGDLVVGGLQVRYRNVKCPCPCAVTHRVVLVAVPGEDRWVVVSSDTAESWPRLIHDESGDSMFAFAERLAALYGVAWGELTDEVALGQVADAAGVAKEPGLLEGVLAMDVSRLRELSDSTRRRTVRLSVVARAAEQAATS